MWTISASRTWIPLYLIMLGAVIWRYRRPQAGGLRPWVVILLILLGFAVAVGGADYISSGIIKHAVCRLRPTHHPLLMQQVHLVNDYRGGLYGFVSSHAANTMACALLFSLLWCTPYDNKPAPCRGLVVSLLMLWTLLNCYSRVYLGVHYVGDIVGGLVVGATMAVLVYWALRQVFVCRENPGSRPQSVHHE